MTRWWHFLPFIAGVAAVLAAILLLAGEFSWLGLVACMAAMAGFIWIKEKTSE